ncbi:MAG: hypothetical protein IID18_01345, partial [Nitrospinae bacterium]|nr:hypothetical protein [Nitrospinota bacterium]
MMGSLGVAAASLAIGNPPLWQSNGKTLTPLPAKGIISVDPPPYSETAPGPLLALPKSRVAPRESKQENCRLCHSGIEQISASHPLSLGCTVCHGGIADAQDKDRAHATLIHDPAAGTGKRNPSSLQVADRSCGQSQCHSGFEREDRNHVERVRKSMMGTLAGIISGLRFQWAGQTQTHAKYGVHAVADQDGSIPESAGAVPALRALPFFSPLSLKQAGAVPPGSGPQKISKHIGDSLLRKVCFQCHLDAPPPPGEYRSQGCATCHFTYNADGRYQGQDATISKTETGHAAFHRMTALPAQGLCVQCHKSFALASDENPIKFNQTPAATRPGRGLAKMDVHLARGMECIDCHTQFDIMGDGNIYSKQHQAVEIRCETCHGNADSRPLIAEVSDPRDRVIRLSRGYAGGENSVGDWMVLSAKQRKLTNVKVREGKIVTLGKRTGRVYQTPLIADASGSHRIPGHKNRLECTACHSQWVPVCKGCHSIFSPSQALTSGAASSGNSWSPAVGTVEIESPSLMIGPRGKVAPMLPQPKRTLSVFDERGNPMVVMGNSGDALGVYREWSFSNPHGYSGGRLAYALNPHSTGSQVRSCASCHL